MKDPPTYSPTGSHNEFKCDECGAIRFTEAAAVEHAALCGQMINDYSVMMVLPGKQEGGRNSRRYRCLRCGCYRTGPDDRNAYVSLVEHLHICLGDFLCEGCGEPLTWDRHPRTKFCDASCRHDWFREKRQKRKAATVPA
jgi:hypothetical protein